MREGLDKIVALDETIVAIATAVGPSAIGVIRVSGKNAVGIVENCFQSNRPLEHRRPALGRWLNKVGEPLDEVIVTLSRSPNSYTGEDLIEVSAHGNPFVLRRIVQCIESQGARQATPGEFTLRAVAHRKIDLMQAEAIGDFIAAQTERQARTALQQIEGSAGKRIAPVKKELIDIIARLEAGIDFAEDDVDVPEGKTIAEQIQVPLGRLRVVKETFGYGRMLAQGVRLTILGKPNVGKSSLFNCLLASNRAIVTEIPGTTRDVLTETVDLEGIPLRLADTAGIHQTADQVERIGVSRSLETLSDSDITLVVLDGSRPLDSDDEQVLEKSAGLPRIVVVNKSDLPQRVEFCLNGSRGVSVSAVTGSGLAELRVAIREFLVDRKTDLTDDFVLTNARQFEALSRAVESLHTASQAVLKAVPHEMVLLDLYAALAALNELTGEVVTEDILDRIFATFCIGK